MTKRPSHQIIHTIEELEALKPNTIIMDRNHVIERIEEWTDSDGFVYHGALAWLPAVVVAEIDDSQVQAARAALEDAS